MVIYGQVIIGPPGSGKTTYCNEMGKFLSELGRKVSIINIDPANDMLSYKPCIDINELITVEDVIECFNLGPNGALVYSIKYLEENVNWLIDHVNKLEHNTYLMVDCPGQVELYTHYNYVKNIILTLEKNGCRFCTVHLVDSHYCNDPGKYISTLLLSLSTMMQMELPHVNVLSKIDLLLKHREKLSFSPEYYTEVLNLSYLLHMMDEDPFLSKYKKLNASLISLIEDYSLVSFIPMNITDKRTLVKVKNEIDKATGYIFNSEEKRQSVQTLLSVAMGETNSDYLVNERIQNEYIDNVMDE